MSTQNKRTGNSPLWFRSLSVSKETHGWLFSTCPSFQSIKISTLRVLEVYAGFGGFKNNACRWCFGTLLGSLFGALWSSNFSLWNTTLDSPQDPLSSMWVKKLASCSEQGFRHQKLKAITNVFSPLKPICSWAMCRFPKKDIRVSVYSMLDTWNQWDKNIQPAPNSYET